MHNPTKNSPVSSNQDRREFFGEFSRAVASIALASLPAGSLIGTPKQEQEQGTSQDAQFLNELKALLEEYRKFGLERRRENPNRDSAFDPAAYTRMVIGYLHKSPDTKTLVNRVNSVSNLIVNGPMTYDPVMQESMLNTLAALTAFNLQSEMKEYFGREYQEGDLDLYLLPKMNLAVNHSVMHALSEMNQSQGDRENAQLKKEFGFTQCNLLVPAQSVREVPLHRYPYLDTLFPELKEQNGLTQKLYMVSDPAFMAHGLTLPQSNGTSLIVLSERSTLKIYTEVFKQEMDTRYSNSDKLQADYVKSVEANEVFHAVAFKFLKNKLSRAEHELCSDLVSAQYSLHPTMLRGITNTSDRTRATFLKAFADTAGLDLARQLHGELAGVLRREHTGSEIFTVYWKTVEKALKEQDLSLDTFDQRLKATLVEIAKESLDAARR